MDRLRARRGRIVLERGRRRRGGPVDRGRPRSGDGLQPVPPLPFHRIDPAQAGIHAAPDRERRTQMVRHLERGPEAGGQLDDHDPVPSGLLDLRIELRGLGAGLDHRGRRNGEPRPRERVRHEPIRAAALPADPPHREPDVIASGAPFPFEPPAAWKVLTVGGVRNVRPFRYPEHRRGRIRERGGGGDRRDDLRPGPFPGDRGPQPDAQLRRCQSTRQRQRGLVARPAVLDELEQFLRDREERRAPEPARGPGERAGERHPGGRPLQYDPRTRAYLERHGTGPVPRGRGRGLVPGHRRDHEIGPRRRRRSDRLHQGREERLGVVRGSAKHGEPGGTEGFAEPPVRRRVEIADRPHMGLEPFLRGSGQGRRPEPPERFDRQGELVLIRARGPDPGALPNGYDGR